MFFKNARTMLNKTGEIHVTHKVRNPNSKWKLVEQAQKRGLDLKKSVESHIEDYPGYINRRGAKPKMGKPFFLAKCCTYMFILGSAFHDSFHKHCEERKSVAMPKMLEKFSSKSHPNSLKAVDLQLESKKIHRKAAESARVDLKASFVDKALDERDEFRRRRDNALHQKDQVCTCREKENIAKLLAEALRLKEDALMQRDLSILELESERKARIDAESARDETLKERDELRSKKDEALQEKAKVTRQLAEALRLKEDAVNQRDISMLNLKLERQARKAAETAGLKFERQARKAAETAKADTEDLLKQIQRMEAKEIESLQRRRDDALSQKANACIEKEKIAKQLDEVLRLEAKKINTLQRQIDDALCQKENACREKAEIAKQLDEALRLHATNERIRILREQNDLNPKNRKDQIVSWIVVACELSLCITFFTVMCLILKP
ncbi:uncharacterized protein LOC131040105 [Cryptomeria japonica]|uniref:uncharacterized protein LOC131040105 n=1 Tax=Cryptomeria japonica TaxID=3369 RepID=UPI0027DA1955|nr:uncharacterized protein LOC131040105 [Cryptomeria japonica]XP_057828945.2 uncharacterized protein LOC131040105 [Cryptomeria japonica]XP_057828946.2 uncharacterized protein LOC131040105 [Cryptomeria japonica]